MASELSSLGRYIPVDVRTDAMPGGAFGDQCHQCEKRQWSNECHRCGAKICKGCTVTLYRKGTPPFTVCTVCAVHYERRNKVLIAVFVVLAMGILITILVLSVLPKRQPTTVSSFSSSDAPSNAIP